MTTIGVRLAGSAGALAIMVATTPARAAGDDTTTGIVAGLGLSAASGKTSVAAGGGAIEATLLDSDAVVMAGSTIRKLATAASVSWNAAQRDPDNRRPTFVVLGHSDAIDFTAARWLERRLDLIDGQYPTPADCKAATNADLPPNGDHSLVGAGGKTITPSVTDIPALLATDTTIQGVTVATDDRLLVDAIAMGGDGPMNRWMPVRADGTIAAPTLASATFRTPGEVIDAPPGGLITKFNGHLAKEKDALTTCATPAGKAWLTVAQAFDASATSTDKGNAPIATAAELLTLADAKPLVLHVAVEQSGGTAITRANVFYTLGFPGAATVSAGLLVSFRLADPVSGTPIMTGLVRCAAAPTRFQDVARIVAAKASGKAIENRVSCSYITS